VPKASEGIPGSSADLPNTYDVVRGDGSPCKWRMCLFAPPYRQQPRGGRGFAARSLCYPEELFGEGGRLGREAIGEKGPGGVPFVSRNNVVLDVRSRRLGTGGHSVCLVDYAGSFKWP